MLKNLMSDEFFCSGSLLRLGVDNTSPIGYGFEKEIIGYQNSNIAFSITIPYGMYDQKILARYPDKDIFKSEFLLREGYLFNHAAVVDVKHKTGHVILFGFKVQNRHQTHGTFKFLFNAIYSAGIE